MSNYLYGFEIDTKEVEERVDDLDWFLKHTNAKAYSRSVDGDTVMFIYETKEEMNKAYEIAETRYKTLSDRLEVSSEEFDI